MGNVRAEKEVEKYLSMEDGSFDSYPWPREVLDSAKHFYSVYTHACLEWAGDLSVKRLGAILSGDERTESPTVRHIVNALYATNNPEFPQFAMALCKNPEYLEAWDDCFTLLAKIKDQRIEDFFIEFLIEDDRQRPWLTKIAEEYLHGEPAQTDTK